MELEEQKYAKCAAPIWEGLIDDDILERFKDSAVFYGDIINAQLIKTNKELIKALEKRER